MWPWNEKKEIISIISKLWLVYSAVNVIVMGEEGEVSMFLRFSGPSLKYVTAQRGLAQRTRHLIHYNHSPSYTHGTVTNVI